LAKAIDTLLHNPELRRRMGESGCRRVEQELSWEVSHHALVRFYGQLLDADTADGNDEEHSTMTKEDVPSFVELRWRSGEHQAALT
jgi:hypothetical protein